MKFQFSQELSVQESIKKTSFLLLMDAISLAKSNNIDDAQIIHELRKKFKRIRGILKIVRPNIGKTYKLENSYYRELSKNLSAIRDKHASIETLTKLNKIATDKNLNSVIEKFLLNMNKVNASIDTKILLSESERKISIGCLRIKDWKIKSGNFGCIKVGLKSTYAEGKKLLKHVLKKTTVKNCHELRKQVKYHYFHLELLSPLWKNMFRQYIKEVDSLSEMLGYYIDLHNLNMKITSNKELISDEMDQEIFLSLINNEQAVQINKARFLAQKIYSQKPKEFISKIENLWTIWQSENIFHNQN